MNTVYFSLGSNEGNRLQWLQQAVASMQALGTITATSAVYQTAAWGVEEQPDFLNIAVCLKTELDARSLLSATQQIEHEMGRTRAIKWGPRTLDIDMLLYNSDIIDTATLTIPHPYMHQRRFVLVPLAEITTNAVHPVTGMTVAALLSACTDTQAVTKVADDLYL